MMDFIRLNGGRRLPLLGFGVFQITDRAQCEASVLNASRAVTVSENAAPEKHKIKGRQMPPFPWLRIKKHGSWRLLGVRRPVFQMGS